MDLIIFNNFMSFVNTFFPFVERFFKKHYLGCKKVDTSHESIDYILLIGFEPSICILSILILFDAYFLYEKIFNIVNKNFN